MLIGIHNDYVASDLAVAAGTEAVWLGPSVRRGRDVALMTRQTRSV